MAFVAAMAVFAIPSAGKAESQSPSAQQVLQEAQASSSGDLVGDQLEEEDRDGKGGKGFIDRVKIFAEDCVIAQNASIVFQVVEGPDDELAAVIDGINVQFTSRPDEIGVVNVDDPASDIKFFTTAKPAGESLPIADEFEIVSSNGIECADTDTDTDTGTANNGSQSDDGVSQSDTGGSQSDADAGVSQPDAGSSQYDVGVSQSDDGNNRDKNRNKNKNKNKGGGGNTNDANISVNDDFEDDDEGDLDEEISILDEDEDILEDELSIFEDELTSGDGGASASVDDDGASADAGGAEADADEQAPVEGPQGDVVDEIPTEGLLPNTGGASVATGTSLALVLFGVGLLAIRVVMIWRGRRM